MSSIVVSTSLSAASRSRELARECLRVLRRDARAEWLDLEEQRLPAFDNAAFEHPVVRSVSAAIGAADGLVLCAPVYNWSGSSELKKLIEWVGIGGALTGKVVTLVSAAGGPRAYMALGQTALSLLLDFQCLINPRLFQAHGGHWQDAAELPHLDTRKNDELAAVLAAHTALCMALRAPEQRPAQSG